MPIRQQFQKGPPTYRRLMKRPSLPFILHFSHHHFYHHPLMTTISIPTGRLHLIRTLTILLLIQVLIRFISPAYLLIYSMALQHTSGESHISTPSGLILDSPTQQVLLHHRGLQNHQICHHRMVQQMSLSSLPLWLHPLIPIIQVVFTNHHAGRLH